jgi:hypothetical protein
MFIFLSYETMLTLALAPLSILLVIIHRFSFNDLILILNVSTNLSILRTYVGFFFVLFWLKNLELIELAILTAWDEGGITFDGAGNDIL